MSMADIAWDPLSEEELKFCWQCLVDQGQLTIPNLQKFMLEVTGEELTPVQARDLLSYLDATGDGRVGMEEFRHFMSASEIQMTDPTTFMWSPTKQFCQERGLVKVKPGQSQPQREDKKEADDDAGPSPLSIMQDSWMEALEQSSARPSSSGRPGNKQSSTKGNKGGSVSARGTRKPLREEEEDVLPAANQASATASAPSQGSPEKKKLVVEDKALAKIAASLEKYQQQTWDRLTNEQEATRRKLFSQFATTNPNALDSTEYHKMLTKMHKLARSAMPGELKAGDTLATLKYIHTHSALNKPSEKEKKGSEKAEAEKAASADKAAAEEVELTLPYELWFESMSGKTRPEVLAAKAEAEQSKAKQSKS